MRAAQYQFHSLWEIPAGLPSTEKAILDMSHWAEWWPGLVASNFVKQDVAVEHSIVSATWKSTFGYQLAICITITAYKKLGYISFDSEGDLVGSGKWSFIATTPDNTQMDIIWNVATNKAWMNLLAPLLRPIFIHAHHTLMKKGATGLTRYLTHSHETEAQQI
jgi:hypothetical protein